MKKRREKKGTAEYKKIDKMIKKRCKERKEEWYNSLCKEVEDLEKSHKVKEMHKRNHRQEERNQNVEWMYQGPDGRVLFDKKEVAK